MDVPKSGARPFQVPPGNADLYNNGLEKEKKSKKLKPVRAWPDFWYLEDQVVWDPLKGHFWARNWKSMWKPYIVNIFYFVRKKNC